MMKRVSQSLPVEAGATLHQACAESKGKPGEHDRLSPSVPRLVRR